MSWSMIWIGLSIYGNIVDVVNFITLVFLILFGVCLFGFTVILDEDLEYCKKKFRAFVIPLCCFGILSALLPPKKDLMIAMALSFGQKPAEQMISDMGSFYPKIKVLLEKELDNLLETKKDK